MNRKRIISLLAAGTLLTSALAGGAFALPAPGWAPKGSPVDTWGQLKVVGNNLVSEKTDETVVLRGVSFGWSSNPDHCRNYFTEKVVGWLAYDWYVSLVRAPLGVGDDYAYGNNKGGQPYGSSTTSKTKAVVAAENKGVVENVIKGAIEHGVYVIIDWHSHYAHQESTTGDEAYRPQAFFKEMAEKYGEYPNIIYEIYNEPKDDNNWTSTIKPYAEEIIPVIRAIDKNNVILVGTPSYSSKVSQVTSSKLTEANVMYTFHFYCNHSNTNELSQSAPVFVSEFGLSKYDGNDHCDNSGKNPSSLPSNYMSGWFTAMEDNKRSWAAWQVTTRDESSAFLTEIENPNSVDGKAKISALKEGNWNNTSDLRAGGKFLREKIRTLNSVFARSAPKVTTSVSGNGTVNGAGQLSGFCPQYSVSATADDGNRFEGWIINGEGFSTATKSGEACVDIDAKAIFFKNNQIPAGYSTFAVSGARGNWGIVTQNNGSGSASDITVRNMEAIVSAQNFGTSARNDVSFRHAGIALENGKRYRLEFEARAVSGERRITPVLWRQNSLFNDTSSVLLKSEMQEYYMEFDMNGTAQSNANLAFYYGQEEGDWVITNIYFNEVGPATGAGTVGNHRVPGDVSQCDPNPCATTNKCPDAEPCPGDCVDTSCPEFCENNPDDDACKGAITNRRFAAKSASWSLVSSGGSVVLRGPVEPGSKVTLYDVRGKVVRTVGARNGMNISQNLPAGNYFAVVRNAAGKEVFKARVPMVR